MRTDRELLIRGVKYLGITALLMFIAPVIIYQAFKNEGHPLYIYVLILGFIFALAAVGMGFYSIRTVVNAFFNKK
ncbi:DUF6095 family protein [Zeaxanthinibacter enoshimensis]|uniref:Uncharacterized protein n=1 Tax=Zeaxanthinibacter enoshimensis TaxID=392009 RepID=A0A4R6TKG6_9FLAO|nr:DUF6095 family protein [Zeaxanthinibacter enoshimensis]TDQ30942.1 hypothetical protein CLV82_1640 [Zeaxanthinibacter enoshimensis]